MKTIRTTTKHAHGFVLLEIMIGVVILGTVLGFALALQRNNDAAQSGRGSGEQLAAFIQVANTFFVANRSAIDAAMVDGTGADQWCKSDVAPDGTGGVQTNSPTKHTCAFDASLLIAKGVWPAAVAQGTRDGKFVVIFRKSYDTQPTPVATGGVEALFMIASRDGTLTPASLDADRTEALTTGKSALGAPGGLVPIGDLGSCVASAGLAQLEVCGNGWKVNLNDFVDAPELAVFAAALPS